MKISVLFCLVVLVLTLPQLYSYNTKRDIQGGAGEELLFDDSNNGCCQQSGSNVDMIKPGPLEVMLDGELVFEVCSLNCSADFLVCYEGDAPNPNGTDLCDTKCGFSVYTQAEEISVMAPITSNILGKAKMDDCDIFKMVNGRVQSRFKEFTSCAPKISENGLVKLSIVNASTDCVVSIKNATIKLETTTAPPTTSTTAAAARISTEFKTKSGPSGNETTTEAPGSFFETYWWIFLIIVIFVVALVAAGIVVYCLKCKKPKKPTPTPPATLRMPQGPQSPAVLQTSAENVKSRGLPSSILNPSSILSHKSLLGLAKKEEDAKQEETDLASLKPTA